MSGQPPHQPWVYGPASPHAYAYPGVAHHDPMSPARLQEAYSPPPHQQQHHHHHHHHHNNHQHSSQHQIPRTSSIGSIDSGRSFSESPLDRIESNSSGGGRHQYSPYSPSGMPDPHYSPPQRRESQSRLQQGEAPGQHARQPSFATSGSDDGTHSSSRLPSIKELCCPQCNKVFLDNEQLREHSKSHVEDRPYHCPICNHTFSRLHDLERHTMIHTGERPHVCDECGRRFARAYTMARHKTGGGGCAGKRQAQRGPRSNTPAPLNTAQSPTQSEHPRPPSITFFGPPSAQGPPS